MGEGSPTKIDCRKKSSLILTSLLEDLGFVAVRVDDFLDNLLQERLGQTSIGYMGKIRFAPLGWLISCIVVEISLVHPHDSKSCFLWPSNAYGWTLFLGDPPKTVLFLFPFGFPLDTTRKGCLQEKRATHINDIPSLRENANSSWHQSCFSVSEPQNQTRGWAKIALFDFPFSGHAVDIRTPWHLSGWMKPL